MPNINLNNAVTSPNVNYIRWQVHGDWVTQLNYDSIKAVISGCNHEPTALAVGCTMGTTNVKPKMKEIKDVGENVKARKDQAFLGLPQRRAERDQTVFCIHKEVKAFTFCKGKNLLLTGGMDWIIRVWNPCLLGKPTGMLTSHTAPVIYIHVSAEDNKIFSMSTDSTIKIWDLETNSCWFTASSKASGIRGEPGACLYLPGPRALYVAADTLAFLHLRLSCPHEPHPVVSHKEPGVCCRYNPTFRQVVSCSEASVVKVWDFEMGRLLFEFTGAHGNAGITCLTFDSNGRRLVTGGRDGCLKIWSYNSGQCLHTLKHDGEQGEVCDCTYLEVNQNNYDGEIIIWNVISGHVYCKLNSPSASDGTEDSEGPDGSVSCLAFLKTRAANSESASTSLMANGPRRLLAQLCPTLRNPVDCSSPGFSVHEILQARIPAWVAIFDTSLCQKTSVSLIKENVFHLLLSDREKYFHENIQYWQDVKSWRAHVSMVTSLELIEEEVLLSSSLDRTMRLWNRDGAFNGTFGQSSPWDIFTPASWSHPRVPREVLTDPQSMPAHPVLEGGVPATCRGEEQDKVAEGKASAEPEKTSDPRSPGVCVLEVEEDSCGGGGLGSSRPPLEQSKPPRGRACAGDPQHLPEPPVPCLSALPEKPDLSILGADLFNLDFLTQEKEGSEAAQKEY